MDKAGIDALTAELEKLGEDGVRANLRNYGGRNRPTVDDWLRKKDQERSDERERSKSAISLESLNIARSELTATRISAVIAIIAIIVAVLIYLLG